MTRAEILDCLTDRPCEVCKFHESGRCERWDCVFEEKPDDAEPCRETDDYENEIADLQNRLDIAEYDRDRWKEKVTVLEEKLKSLSAEPCEDCISRQAVEEIINDIRDCISIDGYCAILERMKKLPPVTPKQKVGRWIFDDKCKEHGHCSLCGYGSVDLMDGEPHDFCRRCGAKMVESEGKE